MQHNEWSKVDGVNRTEHTYNKSLILVLQIIKEVYFRRDVPFKLHLVEGPLRIHSMIQNVTVFRLFLNDQLSDFILDLLIQRAVSSEKCPLLVDLIEKLWLHGCNTCLLNSQFLKPFQVDFGVHEALEISVLKLLPDYFDFAIVLHVFLKSLVWIKYLALLIGFGRQRQRGTCAPLQSDLSQTRPLL